MDPLSTSKIQLIKPENLAQNEALQRYLKICNDVNITHWIPGWNMVGDEDGCRKLIGLRAALDETELGRQVKNVMDADLTRGSRGQLVLIAQPVKEIGEGLAHPALGAYQRTVWRDIKGQPMYVIDRALRLASRQAPADLRLTFMHELAGHYLRDKININTCPLHNLPPSKIKNFWQQVHVAMEEMQTKISSLQPGSVRAAAAKQFAENIFIQPSLYPSASQAEELFAHLMQYQAAPKIFEEFCPPSLSRLWKDLLKEEGVYLDGFSAKTPFNTLPKGTKRIPIEAQFNTKPVKVNELSKGSIQSQSHLRQAFGRLGKLTSEICRKACLPLEIYFAYDEKNEYALWQALEKGTATFTIGLLQTAAAGAVTGPLGAVCLSVSTAAAPFMPDFTAALKKLPSDAQILEKCQADNLGDFHTNYVRSIAIQTKAQLGFLEMLKQTLIQIRPDVIQSEWDPLAHMETPGFVKQLYDSYQATVPHVKESISAVWQASFKEYCNFAVKSCDGVLDAVNSVKGFCQPEPKAPVLSLDGEATSNDRPLNPHDIPTILSSELPLTPECHSALARELMQASAEDHTLIVSPAQLATCLAAAMPATKEEMDACLDAAKHSLPGQQEIAGDLAAAKKLAKEQSQVETADKISKTFEAAHILGQAIVGWIEWSERDHLHMQRSKQTAQHFDQSMRELGLNIKISEFYHQSLPAVTQLLNERLAQVKLESGNVWAEAAKAYQEQVKTTKQQIQTLKEMGDSLDHAERIERLAEILKRAQAKLDEYYLAKSEALQGASMGVSLLQVAGTLASIANPAVGAAVAGAGNLGQLAITHAARQNERRYQKKSARLEVNRQELYNLAHGISQAKGRTQSMLTIQLEKQTELRDFLIHHPELFQPHRRLVLLKSQLVDATAELNTSKKINNQNKTDYFRDNKAYQDLLDEEAKLKSKIPHKDLKYKYDKAGRLVKVEGFCTHLDGTTYKVTIEGKSSCKLWQDDKNKFDDLNKEIPLSATNAVNAYTIWQTSQETVDTKELVLTGLSNGLESTKKNCALPLHLGELGPKMSLDVRLGSSDAHLQTLAVHSNSQDPALKRLWLEEMRGNLQLRALKAIEDLHGLNDETAPLKLADLIAGSLKREAVAMDLMHTEKEIYLVDVHEENQGLKDLEAARDQADGTDNAIDGIAKVEDALAPQTEKRQAQEGRILDIDKFMAGQQQIRMAAWQQMMQLPASARVELCRQIATLLDINKAVGEPSLDPRFQETLLQLFDTERLAQWELWQESNGSQNPTLYKEILGHSKTRQSQLQAAILQGQKDHHSVDRLKQELDAEQKHHDGVVIRNYSQDSSARIKYLSGNTATDSEAALVDAHVQFMRGMQESGLVQQVPKILHQLVQISQQLFGPEWSAKNALYLRLSTAASALVASADYFYEAYKNSQVLEQSVKDIDLNATAWSTLCKVPNVLLGCYVNPLFGGVSNAIEVVQLLCAIINGTPMPKTLYQQVVEIKTTIQTLITNLDQALNRQTTVILTALDEQGQEARLLGEELKNQLASQHATFKEGNQKILNQGFLDRWKLFEDKIETQKTSLHKRCTEFGLNLGLYTGAKQQLKLVEHINYLIAEASSTSCSLLNGVKATTENGEIVFDLGVISRHPEFFTGLFASRAGLPEVQNVPNLVLYHQFAGPLEQLKNFFQHSKAENADALKQFEVLKQELQQQGRLLKKLYSARSRFSEEAKQAKQDVKQLLTTYLRKQREGTRAAQAKFVTQQLQQCGAMQLEALCTQFVGKEKYSLAESINCKALPTPVLEFNKRHDAVLHATAFKTGTNFGIPVFSIMCAGAAAAPAVVPALAVSLVSGFFAGWGGGLVAERVSKAVLPVFRSTREFLIPGLTQEKFYNQCEEEITRILRRPLSALSPCDAFCRNEDSQRYAKEASAWPTIRTEYVFSESIDLAKVVYTEKTLNMPIFPDDKEIATASKVKSLLEFSVTYDLKSLTYTTDFSPTSIIKTNELAKIKLIALPAQGTKTNELLLRDSYAEWLSSLTQPSGCSMSNPFVALVKEGQLIPSLKGNLLPLILPSKLLEKLEHTLLKDNLALAATATGSLVPFLDFEWSPREKRYVLSLHYCLPKEMSKLLDYAVITLATFDKAAVDSVRKIGFENGTNNHAPHIQEFLLQAMYAGSFDLELAGKGTVSLADELYIPHPQPFEGLFNLWIKRPVTILYDSHTYTKENAPQIYNTFLQCGYAKDYASIYRDMQSNKIQGTMTAALAVYAEKYHLCKGMYNSSCHPALKNQMDKFNLLGLIDPDASELSSFIE